LRSVTSRKTDVVDIARPAEPELITRVPAKASPNNIMMNAAQTLLFVAADKSNRITVIDTETNRRVEEIHATAPAGVLCGPAQLPGAAPNSLALSPDEKTSMSPMEA
jgi:YVTN family beta-propeller protein